MDVEVVAEWTLPGNASEKGGIGSVSHDALEVGIPDSAGV
jgi:hypothetical protein